MFQLRLHAGGFHPLVVSHQLLLRFIRQLYSKGTRIFLVASYHYVSIKIVAESACMITRASKAEPLEGKYSAKNHNINKTQPYADFRQSFPPQFLMLQQK